MDDTKDMVEFTCDECQVTYRVLPSGYPFGNGYALYYGGKYHHSGDAIKLCRGCFTKHRMNDMIRAGSYSLRVNLEDNYVYDTYTNMHFKIAAKKATTTNAWGNSNAAWLIRFIGPDGKVWSGRCTNWGYGGAFRRIKVKVENISKI